MPPTTRWCARRPPPLGVLSRGREDDLPPELLAGLPPGFPDVLAAAWRASQASLVALLPDARQMIVAEAGHYIQVEQPQAVIDAVRQVVAGVRDPDTWHDLVACCTPEPDTHPLPARPEVT
jgi:pimeloyl-ACP methyl ester carboxylesterase